MQLEKENDKKEKKKEEVNEQMKISISHSLEILRVIYYRIFWELDVITLTNYSWMRIVSIDQLSRKLYVPG
jgi:hypothetical protein